MTSHTNHNLFVYGSLRSGFQSHAYEYISRFFTLVGPAKVKGRLVDMGAYPAGIPTDEAHYIIGELYQIKNANEFSWAMGQLDDYEGLTVEVGETPLYRREIAEIVFNGQLIPAWVYWYNGEVSGKPVIASGDIMDYLNQRK